MDNRLRAILKATGELPGNIYEAIASLVPKRKTKPTPTPKPGYEFIPGTEIQAPIGSELLPKKSGPGFDEPMLQPKGPSPLIEEKKEIPVVNGGGFVGTAPPQNIDEIIINSAKKHNLDPDLLRAVIFQESRFNPSAVGDTDPNDIGIAQINLLAHPSVTKEQAFDPEFAISFAANKLAKDIEHFGDVNRGLAAYNVGRGGANISGPELFGGGPRGQIYINNVARNLSPQKIEELMLTTSY